MTETLTIRYTQSPIHEPWAWFLPGSSAEDWVRELCAGDVRHAGVRLLVVSRSIEDLEPIGVLAFYESDQPLLLPSRGQAFGRLADRLFLPVEARLEPAIEETELDDFLAKDRQYVWHPLAGLVGFDAGDVLALNDLLLPPTESDQDWTRAHPGVAYARRLTSIEAVQPVSVEAIFESGQDDIGSEADSLEDLPPAPDEEPPRSGIGNAMSAPLRPVAKLIRWLTSKGSNAATGAGGVMERLKNWANRVLTPEQQAARMRELARLLKMLKDDPDNGLKYALPTGGEAPRGMAPPATRLGPHEVDFRFGSSGGPADPWDIPPDTYYELTKRYRELAEREIRLGRHRRAAYIYAELLGEMESAAAALKSGRYYREAALVYEERLNRPHDAAACLEEGGLWDEAIQRYEALREFEKCGRIHRRLEQHDEAQIAFRNAAEACCRRGDLLRGAKLYDEECRDAEQALATLNSGWPASNQARECLRGEFRLLGREGNHQEAMRRVGELIEFVYLAPQIVPLSEVLSETTGNYPDQTVRETAADATRVIVSKRLLGLGKSGPKPEARKLLRSIERLAPEDRLLHRDCERYLRDEEAVRSDQPDRAGRSRGPIRCIHVVQLPKNVAWRQAAASNRYYYAVGRDQGNLILARGEWNSLESAPDLLVWSGPALGHLGDVLLAPSPNDTHDVWLHPWAGPPLPPRLFSGEGRAVTPPWTDRDTRALAQTANGVTWTVSGGEMLVLGVYSSNDVPIISRQFFPSSWDDDLIHPLPMHARPDGAFLALGNRLVFLDADGRDGEYELAGRIIGLSGSAPHSRIRIAAGLKEGGVVLWKDTWRTRQFGLGLYSPKTTFTVTGKLIAADDTKIEVYGTPRNSIVFESTIDSPGDPLSVIPSGRDGFAMLCADGRLSVYQVIE